MESEWYMWSVGTIRSDWIFKTAQEAYDKGIVWTRDHEGQTIEGRVLHVWRKVVKEVNVSWLKQQQV